jgi:hypothetical protein
MNRCVCSFYFCVFNEVQCNANDVPPVPTMRVRVYDVAVCSIEARAKARASLKVIICTIIIEAVVYNIPLLARSSYCDRFKTLP